MQEKVIEFPLDTVVEVRWADASTLGAWRDLDDYVEHGPADCISVGYLMRHTSEDILIMQTQSADGQGNCGISIPKAWLRDLKVLSKPTKRKAKKNGKRKQSR